jgi:hypothetical protein
MKNRSHVVWWLAASALLVPVCAQNNSRRATITGGSSDRGKCTIEVNVDGGAEVQISGDTGRLVTLSGGRAEWRRFQCTGRIPNWPSDFRFRGIDGRGNVALVRDPSRNGGVAIVRIEDPHGGREGYTFDLEWRGGSDNRGRGDRGGYDRGRDDRRVDNGRRDSGPQRGFIVTCSSDDMHRHSCDADTRGGVRMVRQRSDSECRQGYSWGYDRRGIWVDHGCRADFEVRSR